MTRLVPLVLTAPLLVSSLGVDAGAVFQILAIENLGLSPAAIGTALGLGILSLPFQIRAARTPIHRATRNLQLFLVIAAAQAWVLAALVASGASGRMATLALGITIMAEVNVSVLFAPSSQPLISAVVSPVDRQRVNSQIRSLSVMVMASGVFLFAFLSQAQRSVFLVVLGMVAIGVAIGVGGIASPPKPDTEHNLDPATKSPLTDGVRRTYLALSLLAFGAWPLFLVYTHEVLWPEANLGLVGAVQLLGPVASLATWRPSAGPMVGRARAGGAIVLVAAVLLGLLKAPLTGDLAKAAALALVFVASFAITFIRMAALELMHRMTDDESSVRSFTLLDVVASTSLQAGLWVGGLLIMISGRDSGWPLDPYRVYLIAFAAASLWAITRLKDEPARG